MCIVFFKQNHPQFKLIIAGNRDEIISRETIDAHEYTIGNSIILSGTDCKSSNGTWMGITRDMKFAFLTNYREDNQDPNALSRGVLCRDYFTSSLEPLEYLETLRKSEFNGFNLVVGVIGKSMAYYCNREQRIMELGSQTFGVSNITLDKAQEWPKVKRGITMFDQALSESNDIENLALGLFAVLRDTSIEANADLNEIQTQFTDPINIKAIDYRGVKYGTKTHTVIIVDNQNNCFFSESDSTGTRPDRKFEFKFTV